MNVVTPTHIHIFIVGAPDMRGERLKVPEDFAALKVEENFVRTEIGKDWSAWTDALTRDRLKFVDLSSFFQTWS
jgi:hypothetical protein